MTFQWADGDDYENDADAAEFANLDIFPDSGDEQFDLGTSPSQRLTTTISNKNIDDDESMDRSEAQDQSESLRPDMVNSYLPKV